MRQSPRPSAASRPCRFSCRCASFELACAQGQHQRTPRGLLDFVDAWFRQWSPIDLPEGFIAQHICDGRAWVLLDALDEVANPEHRVTVRNAIRSLATDCGTTRWIVTARVAAYEGAPLDDFEVYRVRPLDREQRQALARRVCASLDFLRATEDVAADLTAAIEGRDDLRALCTTPVMVWTAAVIHRERDHLPEGRAALYDAYIDILLGAAYNEMEGSGDAHKAAIGTHLTQEEQRQALSYAAFEVHRWSESPEQRGQAGKTGRSVPVSRRDLSDRFLAGYFAQRDWVGPGASAKAQARDFVNWLAERSGLLIESPEGFHFGEHLSMQEFLAGNYVAGHFGDDDAEGFKAFVAGSYRDTWWRDAFRLAVGYTATPNGRQGNTFLRLMASQGSTADERLAALELAGTACAQLEALTRRRPSWYPSMREELTSQLYDALFEHPLDASLKARHQAGLALGHLWGYPAAIDEPSRDPRFPGTLGLPEFVSIPTGQFIMGRDDTDRKDERPAHPVHLDEYAIAKYPVTNAMFRRFVDDGGYANADWWAEAIGDERWQGGVVRDVVGERTEPVYWTDERWNNPSQPVVGVTWYEAVAYCRWLTAKLRETNADLSPGEEIRLPTEAEWERAAAYNPAADHSRRYPWADEWAEGRANTKEAGLGQTTIAGLLAGGGSALGVMDMVGNVWEWCGDWYGEDYYRSSSTDNPRGPEKGSMRVLRGGSYYSDRRSSRCGYRIWVNPGNWHNDRGIRLARASSA